MAIIPLPQTNHNHQPYKSLSTLQWSAVLWLSFIIILMLAFAFEVLRYNYFNTDATPLPSYDTVEVVQWSKDATILPHTPQGKAFISSVDSALMDGNINVKEKVALSKSYNRLMRTTYIQNPQ